MIVIVWGEIRFLYFFVCDVQGWLTFEVQTDANCHAWGGVPKTKSVDKTYADANPAEQNLVRRCGGLQHASSSEEPEERSFMGTKINRKSFKMSPWLRWEASRVEGRSRRASPERSIFDVLVPLGRFGVACCTPLGSEGVPQLTCFVENQHK